MSDNTTLSMRVSVLYDEVYRIGPERLENIARLIRIMESGVQHQDRYQSILDGILEDCVVDEWRP